MGALHPECSEQQKQLWRGAAPRPCGAEEQWQVAALLLPLGIPLSEEDFSHEVRLLQRPCESPPLNSKRLLLCPPLSIRYRVKHGGGYRISPQAEGVLPGKNTSATLKYCKRT